MANQLRHYMLFTAMIFLANGSVASSPFVGVDVCANCHLEQYDQWQNSHHDLAMQKASANTVLGNFENQSFSYFGTTSTFFKEDSKYFVETDGPEGKLETFEIEYTFGVYPLQQYLVEFSDGRLQSLSIAWDSRSEEEGGQRWFHLYPEYQIKHTDPLHWTGLNQNWNFMCAECHSTNLTKNFDAKTNRYQTSWSEINVACEACHGPGKKHVAWAQLSGEDRQSKDNGLQVDLRNSAAWILNTGTDVASRSPESVSTDEVETCALCHSRRAAHQEPYTHGKKLLHSHLPAMLEEGLYFVDGQINDEVYVYGSFLQSKMYQQGVTCSDCHNPHTLRLKANGNELCSSCHLASRFDTPEHHFHSAESEGARCTACHMPEKTYMTIDDRADHSFHVPRPDLSIKLGVPNACTQCHQDQNNRWAAEKVQIWFPSNTRREKLHYGEIIHAGRRGDINASTWLADFIDDTSRPGIRRATAVSTLQNYINPETLPLIKKLLHDQDSLVRLNAIQAMEGLPPRIKTDFLVPLLTDDLKLIRIEAARVLADARHQIQSSNILAQLDLAIEEYIAAQNLNAERPEAHTNLGALYTSLQQLDNAETAYLKAIEIDPVFVPAYINLADLFRIQNMDEKSRIFIDKAIEIQPDSGLAHHSLGLWLVRRQNISRAMESLKKAAELEPNNSRFQYIYAVALDSNGQTEEAIKRLAAAHHQRPANRDLLYGLISYNQKAGKLEDARQYAKILVRVSPWDQNAKTILENL